jgi:hypothetical protein
VYILLAAGPGQGLYGGGAVSVPSSGECLPITSLSKSAEFEYEGSDVLLIQLVTVSILVGVGRALSSMSV